MGLDPVFLASMPPDIRRELLNDHSFRAANTGQPQPEPVRDSDPMDIADKMHLIYRDEALRARLVDKARIQIKKFDWNISAKKLWDSIMKCVQ